MTPAHRQTRRTRLFADLAADHPGRAVTAVLAALVAAVIVVGVFTTSRGSPGTPRPAAAVTAPLRPVTPESQKGYFAALFTDATIGPKDLSADNALRLGEHVCDDLRRGSQVPGLYAYVRDTTKLDRMQAARLVDDADQQLCPK